jgi:hypothetical protein
LGICPSFAIRPETASTSIIKAIARLAELAELRRVTSSPRRAQCVLNWTRACLEGERGSC